MSDDQYLSVSTFNKKMALYFNSIPSFHNVHVKGEVSGTYISQVGHLYFTLKDKTSKVPCIIYRDNRKNIGFDIENGMKLLVTANVGVYWPHGKYQLDVRSVIEDGLGQLYVKLQQLKKKLKNEGLFEEEHKKELPSFPKRIGVITSQGGSVIHDIIRTVEQKWPYCQVFLFPAAVQGANSKNELALQIKRADEYDMDVLIVARGGGSLEELWSYNEEMVVRTIFNCRTPVISAIGHEDDTTLSDLVADVQASTPTMAASLAIEDRNHVLDNINHMNSKLMTFMSSKLGDYKKQLDFVLSNPMIADSTNVYKSKKSEYDDLCSRFNNSSNEILNSNRVMLDKIINEYVIRYPCKMQLVSSKSHLDGLKSRLIDAMDSMINSHRIGLDKAANKFKFQSEKQLTSKRHSLEISKSYLKSNPCQNQIDNLKESLDYKRMNLTKGISLKLENDKKDFDNLLQRSIIKNPDLIYLDKSRQFHALDGRFMSKSNELIMTKSHELDNMKNASILKNPYSICLKMEDDLNKLRDRFTTKSNGLILANHYRLESIKTKPVIKNHLNEYITLRSNQIANLKAGLEKGYGLTINQKEKDLHIVLNGRLFKNPEILYESQIDELNKIKTSKIIQNPYILLGYYRNELKIYEEKLDKINQVITLKKEQQKQKVTYTCIIVAIAVLLVIILIVIFGGIL
nr:exodeoxyribonuclease VII large subunit [Methanobrevibacter sp.]